MPPVTGAAADSPLDPLRQYLFWQPEKLIDRITELRGGFFLAGENGPVARWDRAEQRINLAEAVRRENLFEQGRIDTVRGVMTVLLGLLAFCLSFLARWQYDGIIRIGIGPSLRLEWSIPTLPYGMRFVPGIGVLISLGAGLYLALKKLPVHDPDPLFDRMLQERAPSPVSKVTVTRILADPRFHKVLDDAHDTTFPFAGEGMEKFIDRLVRHLRPEGQCARFFINHEVGTLASTPELYDHLEHEMREMLFAEIFDDPAFVYIYKRNQPRWRRVFAWFATFDFERVMKLVRPAESHKEKPDKKQTAILALLALLVVLSLNHLYAPTVDHPPCCEERKTSTFTLAHSDQLEQLGHSVTELVAKFTSPQLKPEPRIEVNVPPSPPPTVNVPITLPAPAQPPNQSVTVQSPAVPEGGGASNKTGASNESVSGSSITNNLNLSPPRASQTTGGDDFVKIQYARSTQPNAKAGYASSPASLILHTALGNACAYKVAVVDPSQWPSDPIAIKLLGPKDPNYPKDTSTKNSDGCKPPKDDLSSLSEEARTFSVTMAPSYISLLHAYVSVETFHRLHRPPFAKNFIVLRVHYEDSPR